MSYVSRLENLILQTSIFVCVTTHPHVLTKTLGFDAIMSVKNLKFSQQLSLLSLSYYHNHNIPNTKPLFHYSVETDFLLVFWERTFTDYHLSKTGYNIKIN